MRVLAPQELSREAFRPFGDYTDLLSAAQGVNSEADNLFLPDLLTLHLDSKMPASVCVARVSECERVINAVEFHQFTSEGVLPLDGDIILYVGPSSFQTDLGAIQAFRIPKGTFVRLNPGTLHGRQFVSGCRQANVLILLPERTFGNDCTFTVLEGDDRIQITE